MEEDQEEEKNIKKKGSAKVKKIDRINKNRLINSQVNLFFGSIEKQEGYCAQNIISFVEQLT